MEKVSCNIIKDILPLYLDDVVSEDTKEMVDEHLESCDSCREEAEMLKRDIVLTVNKDIISLDIQALKKLKRQIFKNKVFIAVVSMLTAAAVMFGLYCVAALTEFVVPYDSEKFSIAKRDGKLYACYNGYVLSNRCGLGEPKTVVVDGEEKNVMFFTFYVSPWSKYVEFVFAPSRREDKEGFFLGEKSEIDQIYYGEFMDYFAPPWPRRPEPEIDYNEIIKGMELVWEK